METIIFGKTHHVSSVNFAALADKMQRRDPHHPLFKETNKQDSDPILSLFIYSTEYGSDITKENWNSSIS